MTTRSKMTRYARVVGVTFDNRQAVIAELVRGDVLHIRREPHNPHDANALSVEHPSGAQIGYLPRPMAARLSPRLDAAGVDNLPATVQALSGGYGANPILGVSIRFTTPI